MQPTNIALEIFLLILISYKTAYCDVNVALHRPASQSSMYNYVNCSTIASNAVDGNSNSDVWFGGSCAHGGDGPGGPNWWMVDLGQPINIKQIVITNRNMLYERLDYFIVGVSNSSSDPVRGSYQLCGQYPSLAGNKSCLQCDPSIASGRYVIVQQPANGAGYLTLCEVEIYASVVQNCTPTEKFCNFEFDKKYSIRWNHAFSGQEINNPCPVNFTGSVSRKCLLDSGGIAIWSKTNFNGCFAKEFGDLLTQADNLNSTALMNQTVVAEIANQLSASTNKSEGLSAGNLNASLLIINRLALLRNDSVNIPSKSEIQSFIQAISHVLQPSNSKAWKQLQEVNSSVGSIILYSVEVYGRSLSALNISASSDNLVLEAWSLEKSNVPLQLEFPSRSMWGESRGDKISISIEALDNKTSSETQPAVSVRGSYYRTVHDYLPGNKDNDVINSRVLSFSIDGLKNKEKLDQPVTITLQHNQVERMSFRRICAFWNFSRGEWDSSGCSITSTNLTHTICSCDHLTNFAILMSRDPSYNKELSIISIIGCSISVIALILTIIVYAVTWKQSKSAQATVLLNLCVALITAYIIFMAGADKVNPKRGCIAVAVLLHYFFLTAFFIMLVEGVELLLYIIFVFHVRRSRETNMLIAVAWVLPFVIVAVSLGSTKVEGYGNGLACWLSVDSGLIWAFVAPVLFIVMTNFVILIIVLVWMSRKKSFLAKNAKKRDEIRATIWNLSVTCPVLGLGWLFGVFSILFSSAVFQYLFIITNSLQGLFVFIFHALFHNKKTNEKLAYVYSNYICRCRKSDRARGVSTDLTSSQECTKKTNKHGRKDVQLLERADEQTNLYSTGTQLSGIEDSETMESAY